LRNTGIFRSIFKGFFILISGGFGRLFFALTCRQKAIYGFDSATMR